MQLIRHISVFMVQIVMKQIANLTRSMVSIIESYIKQNRSSMSLNYNINQNQNKEEIKLN